MIDIDMKFIFLVLYNMLKSMSYSLLDKINYEQFTKMS